MIAPPSLTGDKMCRISVFASLHGLTCHNRSNNGDMKHLKPLKQTVPEKNDDDANSTTS